MTIRGARAPHPKRSLIRKKTNVMLLLALSLILPAMGPTFLFPSNLLFWPVTSPLAGSLRGQQSGHGKSPEAGEKRWFHVRPPRLGEQTVSLEGWKVLSQCG